MQHPIEAEPWDVGRADAAMVTEAIRLMRASLELLDRAGAGYTPSACHLSMAVETIEEARLREMVSPGCYITPAHTSARH